MHVDVCTYACIHIRETFHTSTHACVLQLTSVVMTLVRLLAVASCGANFTSHFFSCEMRHCVSATAEVETTTATVHMMTCMHERSM
jgi:hypothetical protein